MATNEILARKWTEEEKEFARKNQGKMKPKEIAKHLGRTEGSVYSFFRKSKARKTQPKKVVEPTVEEAFQNFVDVFQEKKKKVQKELQYVEKFEALIKQYEQ